MENILNNTMDFDEFWQTYPRKVAKFVAKKLGIPETLIRSQEEMQQFAQQQADIAQKQSQAMSELSKPDTQAGTEAIAAALDDELSGEEVQ